MALTQDEFMAYVGQQIAGAVGPLSAKDRVIGAGIKSGSTADHEEAGEVRPEDVD